MSLPTQDGYRTFSLTWPASMLIYWNKRKHLHEKWVQLPEDFLGTPTWPPFHCFGTPIWPPWRHVKTLYRTSELRSRGDERAKSICWEKPVGCGKTLPGYYKWTFELVLSFQDAFLSSVFSLNFECNNYCVNFKIAFRTISPSLKKLYGNTGSSSKLKRNPDIIQRAHWQWRTQIDDTLYPSYKELNRKGPPYNEPCYKQHIFPAIRNGKRI